MRIQQYHCVDHSVPPNLLILLWNDCVDHYILLHGKEYVHCHAIENEIKNHGVDKVNKL